MEYIYIVRPNFEELTEHEKTFALLTTRNDVDTYEDFVASSLYQTTKNKDERNITRNS